MKELEQFLENELNGLALKKADWGHLTTEDDSRERTLLKVQELVKKLPIHNVSNSVCDCCVPRPEDPFEYDNPICEKCGLPIKQTDC